jgi:uncharacterized membrane protein YjfL (UPF0719 family)
MSRTAPWAFTLCVTASLLLIAVGLHFWGAAEVRAHAGEVFWLTFIGAVWLVLATTLFSWLGLSFRDDVVERNNTSALIALCGAVLAVGLIYAGGSFGEGPSYFNNFFSAGLGTAGLFVYWILLEFGAESSVSIAEERDLASGIRHCGFLLAIGLVLGRAVAGDWHSQSATIYDFITDGWPALVIYVVALIAEQLLRPSRRRPFPRWRSSGLLPALLYLALAATWLCHLGPWEGMPR